MKRENLGTLCTIIGTISLADVQLVLGCVALAVGLLLNLPKMIHAWRNLLYDYRKAQTRAKDFAPFGFVRYCFGGMQKPAVESVSSQTDIHFPNDRKQG
jgi:hypothetical protein